MKLSNIFNKSRGEFNSHVTAIIIIYDAILSIEYVIYQNMPPWFVEFTMR